MPLNAPVALFGFNRPGPMAEVFARVREARPGRLFVILDAPRPGRPAEEDACRAVRDLVARIDWPCDVRRDYAAQNLGCRRRMASGISWVFEHADEAILLEDDCVPDPTFFPFCAELLERYRDDSRIGMIAGHIEHLLPLRPGDASYYFDRLPTIWGWATWRRAWRQFDGEMAAWPSFRDGGWLLDLFGERRVAEAFRKPLDQVLAGRLSSWAYAWALSCWRQNFLCAHPRRNLITNIGEEGAHTRGASAFHSLPTQPMPFPLVHPPHFVPDRHAERAIIDTLYARTRRRRVAARLRRLLPARRSGRP